MDATALQVLGYGSGWAVVAMFVLWFFRGYVIQGSVHDRIVEERDRRIVSLEKLNTALAEQNKLLLDSSIPTVNTVLNALHRAAEGNQR